MADNSAAPVGAIVTGGIVESLVYPHPDGHPLAECFPPGLVTPVPRGEDVAVGMAWSEEGGFGPAPAPPEPVAPVPDVISDRQCFQQLAILGKVSQDEAVAAVSTGALPKAVLDGIAALPAAEQFPARMLLCGATEFHRLHPMVAVFLGFFGLGPADRDPLWTAAAAL